jgi:hypothetical protein
MSINRKAKAAMGRKAGIPKRKLAPSTDGEPARQIMSPVLVSAAGQKDDNPLYTPPTRAVGNNTAAADATATGPWQFKYAETRPSRHGNGLFAKTKIPAGTIICPYLGKLTSGVASGDYVFSHRLVYMSSGFDEAATMHRSTYSIDADPKHFTGDRKGLEIAGSSNEPDPNEKENVGIFLAQMMNFDATIAVLASLCDIEGDDELKWHYGNEFHSRAYSVMTPDANAPLQMRYVSLSDKQVAGIVDLFAMINPDSKLPEKYAELVRCQESPDEPAVKKLKPESAAASPSSGAAAAVVSSAAASQ